MFSNFNTIFSSHHSFYRRAAFIALIFGSSFSSDAHTNGTPLFRAASHAPAGVSAEHLHATGEFMAGYMYMNMRMDDLRMGNEPIGHSELIAHHYTSAPVEMTMHMSMGHFMYAPTDWLTLTLMPTYRSMEMEMEVIAMASGGNSGHGSMPMMVGMRHHHKVEGWGDTFAGGLFRLWKHDDQQLLGSFSLSAPTGSVQVKNPDGTFSHYGMQLGSGTWDARPGIVYSGHQGAFSWGAKIELTLRLENENDSGYQLGNVTDASVWTAWSPVNWASFSTRLNYRDEGAIDGHFNGPHNHSSPPDIQTNYGGTATSLGLGFNTVIPSGILAGQRFSAEWLLPLKQEVNGIQLSRELTWVAHWSYAF